MLLRNHKKRIKKFVQWQKVPHHVKPMSQDDHVCAIPDLRFSECFVAMVYIINMLLIFIMIPSLLCFSYKAELNFDLMVMPLAIIPIKQLSGYSYWNTIWRILVAFIPFSIIVLAMYIIIFLVLYA